MTPVTPAIAPPTAADLRSSICRDPAEFAALGPRWTRLYGACAAATPFQSHAWLHSWWLSYGTPGRLRVVLVRRGGELVGAAPLALTYRPYPVLVPLGGAITDYSDVLVDAAADEAAGGAVTAALAAGVRRAARGAVVDLREVRPGAAADRLYAHWSGPKRRLSDSVCLELPGLPMDGLIARVGSSRGQRIRALLRKLDAAGVEERDVPAAEVPTAVENLLRLHVSQWRDRGMNPEHERPRFAAHLARAAESMVAAGEAVITEFSVGGEVVAANLTVLSPGLAGGYLYGASPDLRSTKVDVTTLLMRHGVRQAAGAGRPSLSLLRGAEPHKFHWRPELLANQRLLLAAGLTGPLLLGHYALARLRAAAAAAPLLRRLRRALPSRPRPRVRPGRP
jgi:CelD/BcsL family acetyltransferase involved in cellulose biosynthesis